MPDYFSLSALQLAADAAQAAGAQRHGIVHEAAHGVWYGHGPAGSFFASGTILLKPIVEEGCDQERSNERCTRAAAAAACARAPKARDCACVPAICWQVCEHAGAAEKGHSRVRHFPGLVAFPVVKRAARGVGRGSEARPARRTRRGFAGAACLGSVADGLLRMGARARASAAAACSAA